jgi:hypothetical protein
MPILAEARGQGAWVALRLSGRIVQCWHPIFSFLARLAYIHPSIHPCRQAGIHPCIVFEKKESRQAPSPPGQDEQREAHKHVLPPISDRNAPNERVVRAGWPPPLQARCRPSACLLAVRLRCCPCCWPRTDLGCACVRAGGWMDGCDGCDGGRAEKGYGMQRRRTEESGLAVGP